MLGLCIICKNKMEILNPKNRICKKHSDREAIRKNNWVKNKRKTDPHYNLLLMIRTNRTLKSAYYWSWI